jgi:uncharacterized protein
VIAYVDSSVLVRAYLAGDDGHDEALALLENLDLALVTGSWTRVEVAGALVRAARAKRGRASDLLMMLHGDVNDDGPVTLVRGEQPAVETEALELVHRFGLRAMDAWHLATALLTLPGLADRGEQLGFASRDKDQAAVAQELGFQLI